MALGWRGQYFRYREYFLNVMALYRKRADLRAFLEVILSLSTITIFILFALKPTALTIIDLYNQIQEKTKTQTLLRQKLNDLSIAQSVYNQNQRFIPDIDSTIGSLPVPDAVSTQIQALSAKNSVDLLGLSVGEMTLVGQLPKKKTSSDLTPLPGGANEMATSVNVKGTFSNLESFVKDFENLRLVSKIDLLGFNANDSDSGRVIVAVLSARFPYLGI